MSADKVAHQNKKDIIVGYNFWQVSKNVPSSVIEGIRENGTSEKCFQENRGLDVFRE